MKKIIYAILAILIVVPLFTFGVSAETVVKVDESFDDYSSGLSLLKTSVFPSFLVEVNVIGNGSAMLQEEPSNNLYAYIFGFTQGFVSEPVSDAYTYSMDVLFMDGGHSSVMFLRAEKTNTAFYEQSECTVEGYAGACGRNGITLNLHNQNTLDVTIMGYDRNNPWKPTVQWASFNIPNVVEGKTNIKVVDNNKVIHIYVNEEELCYIELKGSGSKYVNVGISQYCYKEVSVYNMEGEEVLSVSDPLVLTKRHYVGWATRYTRLYFDNLYFSLDKEDEVSIDESSVDDESSDEPQAVSSEESSSEESSSDETIKDEKTPIFLICISVMIISVLSSVIVIILRTKKLQGD